MDTQCGAGGVCSEGFCSFPDTSCDSGLRWGELSGPFSNQCVGDQLPIDARVDTSMPSEAGGDSCFGTGLVKPCFTSMPVGDKTLTGVINTNSSTMCDTSAGNAAWCVIAGDSITVNATGAIGSRPLVIVATSSINVSGPLDVASHRAAGTTGAGGNAAGCNAGAAPTITSGGAGGSLGGVGGAGAATAGGTAGMPGAMLTVTALRGGCPGQAGAGAGGGAAGRGGGAAYLIAVTSITIGGSINASGSGGVNANASSSSGGGGGGSGGMIGLDAPLVMVSGAVFANGGGGGEASGAQSTGQPGSDPADATTPAPGGALGSSFGTDGGPGSAGGQLNGSPGVPTCLNPCTTPPSGGGGGGGAGVIKLYGASSIGGAGPVSPPPT